MTAEDIGTRVFFAQSEVAELFGLDPRTVRRSVSDGEIPSKRYRGRVLIPGAWVREQLDGGPQEEQPSPPLEPGELADLVADRVVARLAQALLAPLNKNGAGPPGPATADTAAPPPNGAA
jgi:excisionase family DNA binding protein